MDYETGVASNSADLLSKLDVFAASNGWTVNTPLGGTSGRVYQKGSIFCGAQSDANGFFFRGCLSYSSGAAWNAQPNASTETPYCNTGAGPFTAYHFFAGEESGNEYLNVIVEISAGLYRHAIICTLVKFGTWTGGTYIDAQYWYAQPNYINSPDGIYHHVIGESSNQSYVAHVSGNEKGSFWCDVDGRSNSWTPLFAGDLTATYGIGTVRNNGLGYNPYRVGYARWNLRTILDPIHLFQNRASNLRSPVGRIPNIRFVSLINHAPGDLITVGGQTWQVFPMTARGDTQPPLNSTPYSGHYGYAYLRP